MKKKVFELLNSNKLFLNFLYVLIVLNVLAIILESYKEIRNEFSNAFYYFEIFSVVIFTIEYILRIWTADLDPKFTGNSLLKRGKFTISTMGLIDLIAILPFYLPFIIPVDLRMLRVLRLFRLLRIFKLGRLSKSLKAINSVLKETKTDLALTVFIAFVLLVLSSTLMYFIESDVQPDKFANIGEAMWWSVATLTTVGYGDVYPITGLGKILSAIIALIGIGFIALPTGIISSAFIEKIQKDKEQKKAISETCECPKCGNEFKKNVQ